MTGFWLLLLFVASAGLVLHAWRARSIVNKAAPTYPPGLEPYPLIGHLPQFLANRHRVLDWMTEALERQTTCTFVLRRPGGVRGAITASPANVEHVLRTSFDNYPKGPRFSSLLHDFLGRGIFTADGEAWRAQRKVASHEFTTRSLRAFVARCVHAELHARFLPLLRRAAASGAPSISRTRSSGSRSTISVASPSTTTRASSRTMATTRRTAPSPMRSVTLRISAWAGSGTRSRGFGRSRKR